jgi:hypothetical protein
MGLINVVAVWHLPISTLQQPDDACPSNLAAARGTWPSNLAAARGTWPSNREATKHLVRFRTYQFHCLSHQMGSHSTGTVLVRSLAALFSGVVPYTVGAVREVWCHTQWEQ